MSLAIALGLLACGDDPDDDPKEKFPQLTVAAAPLFAPLGISTGGYAQSPGKDAPRSPFADAFQATTTIYHPPRVQAFRVQWPDDFLLIVQTDLIGIHQKFWRRVTALVQQRHGVDVRDRLMLLANHTHSGPGHIFDAFFAAQVVDKFNAEIAERVAISVADCIGTAMSGAGIPVRIGHARLANADMHRDRRCENPEYKNDRMDVLLFESTSKDAADFNAVIVNYAMHPTVFSPKDGMLSGDSARAVERGLEQLFDGPVLFAQSWAGDMSPGHPKHLYAKSPHPPSSIKHLDKLESLGVSAQQTMKDLFAKIRWLPNDAPFSMRSAEVKIDRKELGYAKDEFPYDNGAILCGFGESACDKKADMSACIPLPKDGGPTQVKLSAARIGDLAIVTLPGEPLTTLSEQLVDRVEASDGVKSALLFGYAQDYTGYLLLPDDWKAGGYEGGFNYWGPKQGKYLADAAGDLALSVVDGTTLKWKPQPLLTYKPKAGPAYKPVAAIEARKLVQDAPSTVKQGAEFDVVFDGDDPWLGQPRVFVMPRTEPNRFNPMPSWFPAPGELRGGRQSPHILLKLEVTPSFADKPLAYGGVGPKRRFRYTATVRTAPRNSAVAPALLGKYKIRVMFPHTANGDVKALTGEEFEVTSL